MLFFWIKFTTKSILWIVLISVTGDWFGYDDNFLTLSVNTLLLIQLMLYARLVALFATLFKFFSCFYRFLYVCWIKEDRCNKLYILICILFNKFKIDLNFICYLDSQILGKAHITYFNIFYHGNIKYTTKN